MGVSGVGGSASLPIPLSLAGPSGSGDSAGVAGGSATVAGGSGAGAGGTAGTTGSARAVAGSSRAGEPHAGGPGTGSRSGTEASAEQAREPTKPAPLPPLKGLTVAEIRAMLGVAPPMAREAAQPRDGDPAPGPGALDRYA